MSWQGQSPERPHGASEGHSTSIAPPGYIDRPSVGLSKASTTPQIQVPAPAPAPVPSDDRDPLVTALMIVAGAVGSILVLGIVLAIALPTFLGQQSMKDLPAGWHNTEGLSVKRGFMQGCQAGSDEGVIKNRCECVFNAVAAQPNYDTPAKFVAIVNSLDTRNGDPNRLPSDITTAAQSCSGRT